MNPGGGLMGSEVEGGGQYWGGGGNSAVGSTVGVSSTSKNNHPSHHKFKFPKHFGAEKLKEHLMPAGRYLFIPFLRTKSQKRQTKNR